MSNLNSKRVTQILLILLSSLFFLAACDSSSQPSDTSTSSAPMPSNVSEADAAVDANIKAQVESALANATDLPPELSVEVSEGLVLISGSLACEGCGGLRTPGNIGTVQQSLGSVVRAVPGVMRVDFDLSYVSD